MKWGIDLGGTKIEGVVLDDAGEILVRRRIPTEAQGGMDHIVRRIVELVASLASEVGESPRCLGMGTPGSVDPTTDLLEGSNTQAINHKPFPRMVREALGIPVVIENDANCFALAEATRGAVRHTYPDARVVFGVIMGTGVGGGIVIDGRTLSGRHGIGGEWGHTFLHESGGACYCGDRGCVERIISGPALEAHYFVQSGIQRPLTEIAERARLGRDEHAHATLERLVMFFGIGLANVINILDPDVIVLGGGVSNLDVLYERGISEVEKHVFRSTCHTPILRPALGDSAGVVGAALLGV